MTPQYLLDASALLAVIFNEPGAGRVFDLLDDSAIHTLHLAEVARKMVSIGMPADEVIARLGELSLETLEEFSVKHLHQIARLAPEAKRLGLSLGDCVCLTLAESLDRTAVTADRSWKEISGLNVKIDLIR